MAKSEAGHKVRKDFVSANSTARKQAMRKVNRNANRLDAILRDESIKRKDEAFSSENEWSAKTGKANGLGNLLYMNVPGTTARKASMVLRSMSSQRCFHRFLESISGCASSTRRCKLKFEAIRIRKNRKEAILFQSTRVTKCDGCKGCRKRQAPNKKALYANVASVFEARLIPR